MIELLYYNKGKHEKSTADQVMWVFYPSTQRHYRRLIYYLYYHIATCFGRTTIIRQKIY
jgi:hypothetical protein